MHQHVVLQSSDHRVISEKMMKTKELGCLIKLCFLNIVIGWVKPTYYALNNIDGFEWVMIIIASLMWDPQPSLMINKLAWFVKPNIFGNQNVVDTHFVACVFLI